jgi:hypothetical protein
LEALNSIIAHNVSENPHMVLGLLASHRRITFLSRLTLESAMHEISSTEGGDTDRSARESIRGSHKGKAPELTSQEDEHFRSHKPRDSGGDFNTSLESLSDSIEHPKLPILSGRDSSQGAIMDVSAPAGKLITIIYVEEDWKEIARVGRSGFAPSAEWVRAVGSQIYFS